MNKHSRPLEGLKVFDFAQAKSGPYCTRILADFGAEVIDVGNLTKHDAIRDMKASYIKTSTEFMALHRGKKALQLNTKTETGKELAYKLIEKCDIFVENGKPGSAEKMGLGYEAVKKIRPDIIYCSISGFGQTGPYRDRGAFDTVVQAMSGFMSLTGPESGEFTKAGPSMSDISTGICENYDFRENCRTGNYKSAGFTLSNQSGFWSAIGYGHGEYDWLMMASETDGTPSEPVGDYEYITPDLNGFRLVRRGGDWHYLDKNGMFMLQNHQKPGISCENFHSRGVGARLIHIPKRGSIVYEKNKSFIECRK